MGLINEKYYKKILGFKTGDNSHKNKWENKSEIKFPPPPIKIALLGDEKVGKTSISNSFFDLEFQDDLLSTIGPEKNEKKQLLNDGKEVKLILWDNSGQERFRTAVFKNIRFVEGIILVFDVTNRKSFDNLNKWLTDIYDDFDKRSIIILFGNKFDKDKEELKVSQEEIETFAEKNNLKYFEVSAKKGRGINEGISYLINKIYDSR